MIIKADNRGRLALGKLNGGNLAHTEWDVTHSSGTFTVKPVAEEPKSEWEKWGRLDPELIGQVIYVDYDSLGNPGLPATRGHVPSGLVGVLEWYTTGDFGGDVVKVKIAGCNAIEFENYGLFWVKTG